MAMAFLKFSRTLARLNIRSIYGGTFMASKCNGADKKPEVIKCKAAIAWEPKKIVVEEIEVDPPKDGEVRVKIIASGVCHTDGVTLYGMDKKAIFPSILGHEAAGIIESVGPGVDKFKPGDHVIPIFIPHCGECKFCKSGKTNICAKVRDVPSGLAAGTGTMLDGTTRFKCKGKPVYHYMGVSTFSQYTVIPAIHLCKINPEAPLDKVCLLGCGIPTGYGAAVNTAKVEKGSKCAVFGLGGVGLACVMGCKAMGASKIYGVDTNPEKCALAEQFGMTDFINPCDLDVPIHEHIIKITDGGCDYTFEAAGKVEVMRQALESTIVGWGVSVVIGVDGSEAEICTKPWILVVGVTWTGSPYGGYRPQDIPQLVEDYLCGKLMIDEFITHKLKFEEIETAFTNMFSGVGLRSVVYIADEKC